MKIVIVGDYYIPKDVCEKEIGELKKIPDAKIKVLEWDTHSLEELQKKNIRIEQLGPDAEPFPDELLNEVPDADILMVHFCPVPEQLIAKAPKLKMIGCMRGGMENIAVNAAQKRGIKVINTPGRNAEAVADFAVGMILAETRNIAKGHIALKQNLWKKDYPNTDFCWEMEGRKVGIVGFGQIGQKVAHKLKGFDMEVLAYDPFVSQDAVKATGASLVDLPTLLKNSDIVTLHSRLTEETKGLIGAKELAMMKPTAYFINTARAGLVDYKALYDVLQKGKIAGAALDVFPEEPLPSNSPLFKMENVTITPHIAGSTVDAFHKSVRMLTARVCKELKK